MKENSLNLDRLKRIQSKFGELVEIMRQMEDLGRRKEELQNDPELALLIESIEKMAPIVETGEEFNDLSVGIKGEDEDEDELGLIGASREKTVRKLVELMGKGSTFDRNAVHELAVTAIPRWAAKNDARSIGGALNSLARNRSIEVYRQAKAGPAGKPAVFRYPGPAEETTTQNHAANRGDSDDAETVTP